MSFYEGYKRRVNKAHEWPGRSATTLPEGVGRMLEVRTERNGVVFGRVGEIDEYGITYRIGGSTLSWEWFPPGLEWWMNRIPELWGSTKAWWEASTSASLPRVVEDLRYDPHCFKRHCTPRFSSPAVQERWEEEDLRVRPWFGFREDDRYYTPFNTTRELLGVEG